MSESKPIYKATLFDTRALAIVVAQILGKPVDDETVEQMIENGFEASFRAKSPPPMLYIRTLQASNKQRAARRRKWRKKASMG